MLTGVCQTGNRYRAELQIWAQGWATSIGRAWDFTFECILKEFPSCLRHVGYRVWSLIQPNLGGMNSDPETAPGEVVKVTLLLHGAGGHYSCFKPLVSALSANGVNEVHSISLNPTEANPVPIEALAEKVENLRTRYLGNGASEVQFNFVGHSLGALVASKYLWRSEADFQEPQLISIAGRLKYESCPFDWFCQDVRPDIEATYAAWREKPSKVRLVTIRGSTDAIVPAASVHIQKQTGLEHTIEGWGHGGIIYAPEAHEIVVRETLAWMETDRQSVPLPSVCGPRENSH